MVEDLLILPFVLWGRVIAGSRPLKTSYEVYFFFPFHHIGGAERVHASIVQALRGRRALVIFTRRSHNEGFLQSFRDTGLDIMDISAYTDNKWKYWNNLIYRGIFSGYINKQQAPCVIFNGHSNFAYKLSRWIRKDIPQLELIHSFSSFSYIRVPFIPFYRETVMISRNRIQDHINLYSKWGIPTHYDARIRYVLNGIDLPERKAHHFRQDRLDLLYVGRGTPEKRVHLAAAIARELRKEKLPVQTGFVGDVDASLEDDNLQHDTRYGNVDDAAKLDDIYCRHGDVLLITSDQEGFPMVIMEAMARGSIILATPVGDIPVHVKTGVNGHLFTTVKQEQQIIREAVEYIRLLLTDPELCRFISDNNIRYAYENFGLPNFERQYRELIERHLH